jgi:hypothetical protein
LTFQNFIPELWSGVLLDATNKALVYGSPLVSNTDYEGQITQQGDSVNILTIGKPTIKSYVAGTTTVTPEQLDAAQKTLHIDQADYFAVSVRDVDRAQMFAAIKGGLMSQVSRLGGIGMAETVDAYLAGLYTQASTTNALGTISVTTGAIAYTTLRKLALKLDEANVPNDGTRYAIARPWFWSLLLEDDRFVKAAYRGDGGATLANGWVGDIPAFSLKCLASNNAPLVTGDDYAVQAGHPGALSSAMQLTQMEAYRPEADFADAIKGLQLYGGKVVRPDWMATAVASQT